MYSVKGDGILIYSDVSTTESRKASSPKLTLKDNAAGSLEITIPPGNAGYDTLLRMKSELIVYRDNKAEWYGRIIIEKTDFWNNRVLTCEGELAYLNDTHQPQYKYPAGTTVRTFLENVLSEHNKRYDDERYKFYIGESLIYNADEPLPEIVTDCEKTLDCINTNIIDRFECHIRIEHINGKKYVGFVKDEALFNENTQTIRFGDNLLDFTKNWDLTELETVIIPRGAKLETGSDEDSDAFDTYVSLGDIPNKSIPKKAEIGEYLRYKEGDNIPPEFKVGDLVREVDENGEFTGQLVYVYPDIPGEWEYEEIDGYIVLERDGNDPTIRVDVNASRDDKRVVEFLDGDEVVAKIVTDGSYADVYLKNQNGEFYSLKDEYGWIENVVEFSDAENSVELLKKTRDYIQEHRFDQMELEVSAVDMQYLMGGAEPIKMLDRMRCISYPHGMNTLFTVTELSIELDRPDSAKYTLQKTLHYSPKQSSSLSGSMSVVAAELTSPNSTILTQAKSDADKTLREKTNGYVSLVTDTEGGRHSEALIISSGRDYKRSSHFWIWNSNGLGHYTEYGDDKYRPTVDKDDQTSKWLERYTLNLGITMDGAIVANRITVGHMSADRVRTGVLMSQDGNVVWNLNATDTYVAETGKTYLGGSLTMKKGSIALGTAKEFGKWPGAFSVDDDGNLHAEKGNIGGFVIESDNIHNDRMLLDGEGLHMYRDSRTDIGFLGISYWEQRPSYKSLAMNMENEGSAIWWSYRQRPSDDVFTVKLMYVAEKLENFKPNTLNALCDFYFHSNTAYELWIDSDSGGANNGLNGTCILLTPDAINDDGTVDKRYAQKVTIKNGFVVYG